MALRIVECYGRCHVLLTDAADQPVARREMTTAISAGRRGPEP
jgi:hypothetical protein